MSGAPPTDRERARRDAELIILRGYQAQHATARRIGDPYRRRRALDSILTGVVCHPWPTAAHADLAEIRAAALALAEEIRGELHGPRIETTTMSRDGRLVTVGGPIEGWAGKGA